MPNPIPKDNLEADLRKAINDGLGEMGINTAVGYGPLLQKLVIHAVARDRKVWLHGYREGRRVALKTIKIGAN